MTEENGDQSTPSGETPAGESTPDRQLTVSRRQLLTVWKVIEKLVVSADRIAGAYEYQREGGTGEAIIDVELRQEHDRALCEYLDELAGELVDARNTLIEHLDLEPDEADHLTRNVIQYWTPDRPTFDYEGESLKDPDIELE